MFDSKYSNLLTVLLVVVIIGIVGLLIFLGVDIYNKYYIEKETGQGVEDFNGKYPDRDENEIIENDIVIGDFNDITNETTGNNTIENPYANMVNNQTSGNTNTNNTPSEVYYKGFVMKGTISIPKTGLECPILEKATKSAIEVAVGIQYGPGLNQVGNTIIAGHNYRNGLFFSNNKRIEVGDKIYIKDTSGVTVTYTVYSKFETTPEDASYINRDTNGAREITLYTCNDDSSKRIIILARE